MTPTFAGRWRQAVAGNPDGTFLVWEGPDGATRTWTYAAFDALVARVAGGLMARAVGPGSSVHLVLANSPAFVATWIAATRLGARIVPSDPGATAPELAGHVERTRPAVAVVGIDRQATYDGAIRSTSPLRSCWRWPRTTPISTRSATFPSTGRPCRSREPAITPR